MQGTPFGQYRLLDRLGSGGMGEVWRAYDTNIGREVAIKVLHAGFATNPAFTERFRREAFAAARLNSPHVAPIHDFGEIDGRLFVDMRLIEGRDLTAVLADGPLEPQRAVEIIEQIASALHAAHQSGVVHRDVKPSNVMLDTDDFAYLIDFGIAQAAADSRLTGTGNTIGTFAYMAPERFDSSIPSDARCDVYALACVLYECLTGAAPFAVQQPQQLMAAHLSAPPPQPTAVRPGLPRGLDDVVAKGMAKSPDDRYATTRELAHAAVRALETPGLPPPPPPPVPPVVRPEPEPPNVPRFNPASSVDPAARHLQPSVPRTVANAPQSPYRPPSQPPHGAPRGHAPYRTPAHPPHGPAGALPPKRPKRKVVIGIVIGFVLLVLIAAAVLIYYFVTKQDPYYDPYDVYGYHDEGASHGGQSSSAADPFKPLIYLPAVPQTCSPATIGAVVYPNVSEG